MNVVITGGAGFIGSALVDYHLQQGDHVHVIDDLSSGSLVNLKGMLENPLFHGHFVNLKHFPNLEFLLEKAEVVYHFAAIVGVFKVLKDPIKVLDVNIQGTLLLLESMRISQSKARLIIASSSEIYGGETKISLSETHNAIISAQQQHRSNYAISKLVDEAYGLSYYEMYGIKTTIIRIFNVIGRHQTGAYGMVVPRFINAAIQHHPLTIYGSGHQKRSFCDIRDFVAILIKIIHEPTTIGEILNIGHDEDISISDLAKRIIHLSNSHSKITYTDYNEIYGKGFVDFKYRRPDLSYLKKFIHFEYQWNLENTLIDLINYAREKHVSN